MDGLFPAGDEYGSVCPQGKNEDKTAFIYPELHTGRPRKVPGKSAMRRQIYRNPEFRRCEIRRTGQDKRGSDHGKEKRIWKKRQEQKEIIGNGIRNRMLSPTTFCRCSRIRLQIKDTNWHIKMFPGIRGTSFALSGQTSAKSCEFLQIMLYW